MGLPEVLPVMRRACALFVLLCGCVSPAYRAVPVQERAEPSPLSVEDVLKLTRAGVPEDITVTKVRADGILSKPTAEQIVMLKKEGVSDRVIEALVGARVVPAFEPAPPRVFYRDSYAPGWCWDPWWGWPYPYWHIGYYGRYRTWHY